MSAILLTYHGETFNGIRNHRRWNKQSVVLSFLLFAFLSAYAQCTGDCTNGFGSIDLGDGNHYDGYFKDGKRHGFGTLKIGAGATYTGEFINEQMWGLGIVYGNKGEYLQSGLYNNNKLGPAMAEQTVRMLVMSRAKDNGTSTANRCIEGDCQNGFGIEIQSDGGSYGGNFKSGLYDGWGHLKLKDGAEYIGEFSGGGMAGWGIVYGNSGEFLKAGIWAESKIVTDKPEAETLEKVIPKGEIVPSSKSTVAKNTSETKKPAETVKPTETKNLTAQIKEFADQKMKEWEVKGEFEKSEAYAARVNSKSKGEQNEKFKKEAIQNIGRQTVNWSNTQSKYDADKELFTVTFDNKFPVFVKVPIDKAKSFADNIKTIEFQKSVFTVVQNELVLSQVEVMDKENSFMGFSAPKDALAFVGGSKLEPRKEAAGILNSSEHKSKIALVIGNSEYPNAPLKNPGNDASSFSSELKLLGFEVIHYNNASRKVFREAIHEFGEKLNASKGIGLFYYAGHGLQSNGVNYLVPVDAIVEKDYDIQDECIRADVVLRMMEMNNNPMNIIILDACRNNPYVKSSRSLTQGLAQPESAPTGSIIAFATAPGKTASDGDGVNGLYTQELIKAMRKPGLSLEQIFKEVRINVAKLSGDKQVPWENSSLMGDFFFRKN